MHLTQELHLELHRMLQERRGGLAGGMTTDGELLASPRSFHFEQKETLQGFMDYNRSSYINEDSASCLGMLLQP